MNDGRLKMEENVEKAKNKRSVKLKKEKKISCWDNRQKKFDGK